MGVPNIQNAPLLNRDAISISREVAQTTLQKKAITEEKQTNKTSNLIHKNKVDELDSPSKPTDTLQYIQDLIKYNQRFEKTEDGDNVVKILDKEGEIIRQVPSEVALKIAKTISEYMRSRDE